MTSDRDWLAKLCRKRGWTWYRSRRQKAFVVCTDRSVPLLERLRTGKGLVVVPVGQVAAFAKAKLQEVA